MIETQERLLNFVGVFKTLKSLFIYNLWVILLSLILIFGCNDDKGDGTPGNGNTGSVNPEGQASSDHWIFSVVFKRIKSGSFTMGSPPQEKYSHEIKQVEGVEISKSFEIMEKEVTQRQWLLVKQENPSEFKEPEYCDDHEVVDGVKMCPNHPVDSVSWDDVQEYIRMLNESLGLTGCNGTPQDKSGCYRLPTEAEWEYAVRAGSQTVYFFGDNPSDLGNYAWYWDNIEGKVQTRKVGLKSPNPNGLYDVYGNVHEWVQDGYRKELPGGKDPLVEDEDGSNRVLRGGAFYTDAQFLSSAKRTGGRANNSGFRFVRTL